MKDDECRRDKYEGDNLDNQDNIFCFEGGNRGTLVWMVLVGKRWWSCDERIVEIGL
jgi:hypothetical protein